MTQNNPGQFQAAGELNQVIISKLATERGVHAETAISAAARLAGTCLLRSAKLPLTNFSPGTSILSDAVDESGQKLLGSVGQTLASLDVPFDPARLDYDLADEHRPHLDLLETQALLEPSFRAILANHGLNEQEGASAAAIATAILIHKCAGFLDPHVAYVIAVYGMVEASKTVPFESSAVPTS